MVIRRGVLAVVLLSGCTAVGAPGDPLPAGTMIAMKQSRMGTTLGSVVLAPDNSVEIATFDDKSATPTLAKYRGTVDAGTAASVRSALAPWFLGRPTPECERPFHDAPGLDVSALVNGKQIGTAHAYFGCQGDAYAAYSTLVGRQYRALKDAARLEKTPYATVPARN